MSLTLLFAGPSSDATGGGVTLVSFTISPSPAVLSS